MDEYTNICLSVVVALRKVEFDTVDQDDSLKSGNSGIDSLAQDS
jgi:hypothetical protein